MDFDFARLVRTVMAGTERDAGQSGPAAKDSQAPPNFDTGNGTRHASTEAGSTGRLDRGATGPAMRGQPNDYAWGDQDRMQLKAQREGYINLGTAAAAATVVVDPNLASNFVLRTSGAVTIAVVPPEAAAATDPYAPAATFLYGVKLWVLRTSGAKITWQGVLWSQDVLDPDGDGTQTDSLLGPASESGWDSYVLVTIPGVQTFGYLAGRNFKAQASS